VNIKLTKENIGEMMSSIQIHDLTQNFQDAVSITRKLGYRYLWIDSLCIVQNDKNDWHTQSAEMGLVYANAKCVISADASLDSNGGCYYPRDLFRQQCILTKRGRKLIVARSKISTNLKNFVKAKVDEAPLATRAWTYQERFLSKRILHFCKGGVVFECSKLVASDFAGEEEYQLRTNVRWDGKIHPPEERKVVSQFFKPTIGEYRPRSKTSRYMRKYNASTYRRKQEPEPFSLWPRTNPNYAAQKKVQEELEANSARWGPRGAYDALWRFKGTTLVEKLEFHERWYELVEQYSIRNLTFESDKLEALKGLPYFIQKETAFTYAAGLWLETMAFNLLWVVVGETEARSTALQIPTWSWASINGKVSHRLKTNQPHVYQLKKYQSVWETSILQVLIDDIRLEIIDESPKSVVLDAIISLQGAIFDLSAHQVNIIFDHCDYQASQQGAVCLPILRLRNHLIEPMIDKIQIHGIVLQPTSKTGYQFRRVGYFWAIEEQAVQALTPSHSYMQRIELV